MRHAERASVVLLVLAVVLGLATTATFAAGRAYRSLVHPSDESPDRPAFVTAPDPILRAAKGLEPNSTDIAPGISRPDLRTIQVLDREIHLLEGGQLARLITVPEPLDTPQEIVAAIDDPAWMRLSAADEVVIDAALVMQPGTTLRAAAPLRRIVLQTQPGVFLGGSEARLSFVGVEVEASDRAVPPAGEVGSGDRPFVVAQGGSMEITDSTFRYLGRDWNDSYGVAWTRGAAGFAVRSTFEHNFTGIFAANAIDVRFDGNTLRENSLNGLTAYEVSAGLLVERNVIEGNGRSGIILSGRVTRAELHDNTVRRNGFDGIMSIGSSDDNVIRDNLSQSNGGDGVVVSSSSGTTVEHNRLIDNRVAVSVNGATSSRNVVRGNVIDDNGLAVQGLDEGDNTVLSNGDYWRPVVLVLIWVTAVVAFLGIWRFTTWSIRHRTPPRGVRHLAHTDR